MKQNQQWVLVANASSAKIFHLENKKTLVELNTFSHPESRLHEQDLTSSAPGRDFTSMGSRRHAMEPKTTQKDHEFELFAKSLSEHLDTARLNKDFSQLIVMASPNFLGILRHAFSPATKDLINKEINKDVVHMSTSDILEHLSSHE
jgi:protein required for attachment to host cells